MFLIRKCFYSKAKKYNSGKKAGTNFDMTTNSVVEKY